METNPVMLWLLSTNKMVKDSLTQETTHHMMNGGKIDLTKDYDTFLQIYAKNIKQQMSIVEKKTKHFKFFIDLDFLALTTLDITEYLKCIFNTLNYLYGIDFKCILTKTNKNKEVKKEEKVYIKQGYHLHWPELIVDCHIATKIRNSILIRLNTQFGKIENCYDNWDKIVDHSVYGINAPGIRMIGSDKCIRSDGREFWENRIYMVEEVYIGNTYDEKMTKEYKDDIYKSVVDTSVRSNSENITNWVNMEDYNEDDEEEADSVGSIWEPIKKDSKEYDAIYTFFSSSAIGYKKEDIRKILKSKQGPCYIIDTRSKYCQNIGGYHTNNHIHFKLTPNGLFQKCKSESIGLKGTCCRDFECAFRSIEPRVARALGWHVPTFKDEEAQIKGPCTAESLLARLEKQITGSVMSWQGGPNKKKPSKKS